MSDDIKTSNTGATGATVSTPANLRILLTCGVIAGPLFVGVVALQALTRDGFDLSRHLMSLLSLGDLGWIQITNFVVAGLLSIAFAVGMWLVLHPGRAGTWGPILMGVFGTGLVAGGAFVTDPSLGFPPGARKARSTTTAGTPRSITSPPAFRWTRSSSSAWFRPPVRRT